MVKQVLLVRRDLAMSPGKAIAQAAHAAVQAVLGWPLSHPWMEDWIKTGFTKVALAVNSQEELQALYRQAEGLPRSIIQDEGRTELEPGTWTCGAIGPAPSELINKITGQLKLY